MDASGTLQPTTKECIHFSSAHKALNKSIHHILCHKASLNKFKRIQIIQSKFCDYKGIALEITSQEISGKSTNISKLDVILLNNT